MKFIARDQTLYTDDERLLKKLSCPLKKEWRHLVKIEEEDRKRKCNSCKKNVLDISEMSEDEVACIVNYDPDVCLHISSASKNIEWIGDEPSYSARKACHRTLSAFKGCRLIKTARTKEEMNLAAEEGYKVLLKVIEANPEIKTKIAALQNSETQKVSFVGDYRLWFEGYVFYNPSVQSFPFAAYLVPKDIEIGERVYILDLIENIVGSSWNQGDAYRCESYHAVWNGEDFDLEPVNVVDFLG